MGRKTKSQEIGPANPASKCLTWKAGDKQGFFHYYDKEANDGKGADVKVDLPLRFVFLEDRIAISGFSKSLNCGVYTNEVAHAGKKLKLLGFVPQADGSKARKILVEGVWKNVKGKIKDFGGKWGNTIYAMALAGNANLEEGEVFRIHLTGASCGAWGDFEDTDQGIEVKTFTEGKNGATTYRMPCFEPIEISDESDEAATKKEMDVIQFFEDRDKFYGEDDASKQSEEPVPVSKGEPESDDDEEF